MHIKSQMCCVNIIKCTIIAERLYYSYNINTIDWNLRVIRSHSESATHFMTTMNDLFLEQILSEPIWYRVGQKENILD